MNLKYIGGKARHRYEVSLRRNVAAPEYGPEAYFVDTMEKAFPFGSGQQFTNGKAAEEAAIAYARAMEPLASSVLLTRCNGYGGSGKYIKESDQMFTARFAEEA